MRRIAILGLVAAVAGGALVWRLAAQEGPSQAVLPSGPFELITPQLGDRLARMRLAGLSGDRAAIPALLGVLRTSSSGHERAEAMRALTYLEAVEAAPALQALAQAPGHRELSSRARAARARLLAWDEAHALQPQQRAARFVERFFQEMGMSAGAAAVAMPGEARRLHRLHGQVGPALLAARELADVVYRQRDTALAAHLDELGFDFSLDAACATKMRLAMLTREERVRTIVDELAGKRVAAQSDLYAVQLAVDEGRAATDAVVAKLQSMEADPKARSERGYAGLFRILRGTGDATVEPLLARYATDPEKHIAHYAGIAYSGTKRGLMHCFAPGD